MQNNTLKMLMMVAGLATSIFATAENAVSFVPEGATKQALTPKNVTLVSESKGDINKDGIEDLLLVFEQNAEEECKSTYWAVYFGTSSNVYKLFGAYECGSGCTMWGDDENSMQISSTRQEFSASITSKGLVSLKDVWQFRLASQQHITDTRLYRFQDGDLYCIGSEHEQYGTWGGSAGYGEGNSINYSTKKRYSYGLDNGRQVDGKWEKDDNLKLEALKSVANRVWSDGSTAMAGMSLEDQLKQVKPIVVLPPANFDGFQKPASGKKTVKLQVLSSKGNDIVNVDSWVANYSKGMPYQAKWKGHMNGKDDFDDFLNSPKRYEQLYHGWFERHNGYNVVAYGRSRNSQFASKETGYDYNVMVELDPNFNTVRRVVDFRQVADAFNKAFNPNMGSCLEFHGYVRENNILYVAMSHKGYSSGTGGKNAYLIAVDLKDGEILWMTQPLTCNSEFIIIDNSIVCGYGFSGEPHYVCVIDKYTGQRTQKLTVLKSPELFSLIGDNLYMRTYSYDYVLKVVK